MSGVAMCMSLKLPTCDPLHVCASYSGNYDVLALRNGYHGMSEGTMGVTAHSTWKFNVPQVGLAFKSAGWCP